MSDATAHEDDGDRKKVPGLSDREKRIAADDQSDDASLKEAEMFGSGASQKAWRKDAEEAESRRAERFRDNFETISICSIWFLFAIFGVMTAAWAYHLVAPKKYQVLDDNQEDKLQLIITGGFVAGIASSHLKKRLGS